MLFTGDIAEGRAHLDQAIALYDPAEHRPLATRFGQDVGVAILSYRSMALWLLGYPEAALADADDALKDAREIGQAATLMYALMMAAYHPYPLRKLRGGKRASSRTCRFGGRKRRPVLEGDRNDDTKASVLALTGKASDAVEMFDLRDCRISIDGSNTVDAAVFAIFGERPCGAWPIRRGLALHRRSDDVGGNNQGKVVRGRDPSRGRRNRADVARSRTQRKRKRISSARSRLRARSKQSPGSCARR